MFINSAVLKTCLLHCIPVDVTKSDMLIFFFKEITFDELISANIFKSVDLKFNIQRTNLCKFQVNHLEGTKKIYKNIRAFCNVIQSLNAVLIADSWFT